MSAPNLIEEAEAWFEHNKLDEDIENHFKTKETYRKFAVFALIQPGDKTKSGLMNLIGYFNTEESASNFCEMHESAFDLVMIRTNEWVKMDEMGAKQSDEANVKADMVKLMTDMVNQENTRLAGLAARKTGSEDFKMLQKETKFGKYMDLDAIMKAHETHRELLESIAQGRKKEEQ